MKLTSFADVQKVLADYIPHIQSAREAYSMVRIEPLMAYLGNPEKQLKIVHVAGTSGKTSTAYYIAAMLQAGGQTVGLTVSPHIDCVNERLQINQVPLPEKEYIEYFEPFIELVAKSKIHPTYFEVLIAFAYWVFQKRGVDYAVIEVGVGGLLDSTNIARRSDKVCVLTDIGNDHSHILGKTIASIASHKAGIIRPHNVVFMYAQSDEVMDVVREVVSQQQAELHELLTRDNRELPENLPYFQRRNWYLASAVARYVRQRDGLPPLTTQDMDMSTRANIPARLEEVDVGGRKVILDGAHNPQKMEALVGSLKALYPRKRFGVLFALIKNQNGRLDGTLDALLQLRPELIITSFKNEQSGLRGSVNPIKIAEACHMKGFDNWKIHSEPDKAFGQLLELDCDVLLVVGSFHLLFVVRPLIPSLQRHD